jgi:Lon protease-like protein
VLFPHVSAPLHVFESRYRALVRDALAADRLLAIALLKPGWQRDYAGSPEFFETGCLARLEEAAWRPDDCFDVKVVGLARVRFDRVTSEYPYRAARVTVLPQEPIPDDDPLIDLERRALLDAYVRAVGEQRSALVPGERAPALELVVNGLCCELDLDPAEKLALLELDSLLERSRRLRERLERVRRAPPSEGEAGEHN